MMPSVGDIRARRDPSRHPEERDGRLVFEGEIEWLVEGVSRRSPHAIRQMAEALGGACERLGEDLLLLDFGNSVGFFDVPGLGRIEVVSSKWREADYDRMLADLMTIATALPFAAEDSAALPYDRSIAARHDVLYHAFVYLRHVLSDSASPEDRLLPALEMVLRDPYVRFEQLRRMVPLDRVRRVDGSTLLGMVTSGEPLFSVSDATRSRLPLAAAMRGHMPERVREGQVELTFDTPENRFAKAFIQMAVGVIEGMKQVAQQTAVRKAFAARLLADCDRMENRLWPIQSHPIWEEIGPMVHLPANSTVLHRRRGYKEVFRHFARLRLAARVPLPNKTVLDLLEVKDIALLYELWTFFSLVREVETLLGPASKAAGPKAGDMQLRVPRDLSVEWSNGYRLTYNSAFSRSKGKRRRSYSVPLRPDIVLEVPNGSGMDLHLFDAKFRLRKVAEILAEDDDAQEDEEVEERRGTFRRGDLYKMHTYRDAIDGARSVWALYPGTEMRFFDLTGARLASKADDLPTLLDGVGAIPLMPNVTEHSDLRQVLARMILTSKHVVDNLGVSTA